MVISTRTPDDTGAIESFITQRLNLRQLRVLLALHETGSLVKAAERLHLSQPAISKTLSELESGLGQTLFLRRGRNARFTPPGLRLVDLAQHLEGALRRGAGDVSALALGATGVVRMGATNAGLTGLLPQAVSQLKQEQGHVTVSVHTHALQTLFDELRRGQIDLVMARVQRGEEPAGLNCVTLHSEREVLAISALSPLARSRRIGWETLNQQPWIWSLPGTRSRAQTERLWQRQGLAPPVNLIETGDVAFALALMRQMPLLALLPISVATEPARNGVLVMRPLADTQGLELGLGLGKISIFHLPGALPATAQRLVDLLQDLAGAAAEPTQA